MPVLWRKDGGGRLSDLTVGHITQLCPGNPVINATRTPINKEQVIKKDDALQRIAEALEGIESEIKKRNEHDMRPYLPWDMSLPAKKDNIKE